MATARLVRVAAAGGLNGNPQGALCYVGSGSGGGATPDPSNLLSARNSAIESGDLTASHNLLGNNVSVTSDTSWAPTGYTRSLRYTLTGTGNDSGVSFYTDSTVPGTAYRFRAKVRRVVASNGSSDAVVQVVWRNSSGIITVVLGVDVDWQADTISPVDFTFVAPPGGTTCGMLIRFPGAAPSGSYLQIADVSIVAVAGNPNTAYEQGFTKPVAGLFTNPSSEWLKDITAAPLHPDSSTLITTLVNNDITPLYSGVTVFNTSQFNSTTYVVSGSHPKINVGFCDAQTKNNVPGELYANGGLKAFRDVPIPWHAMSGGGGDGHIAIYCPDTDQLWEFWQFYENRPTTRKAGGVTPTNAAAGNFAYQAGSATTPLDWTGYSATWGGRIDNVSQSIRGTFPGFTGTTATGLAMQGGNVGIEELRQALANGNRALNHAIALSIVYPRKFDVYSYPAQRSDGFVDSANNLPEGLRIRLKSTVNVDSLSISPIAKVVAKTMQKYGCIIVDKSGGVEVEGESARSMTARGLVDPWPTLNAGGANIMAGFPWAQMEALPFDYGKP